MRAGVLDMGRSDAATVRWVSSGKEPAMRLELGPSDALLRAAPESERPRVDLLLAMPRPLQFGRMLPMMSSLGIGTLWVTKAAKTEKAYFSSHLLRAGKEAELRAALVEDLAQAGDTAGPRVRVQRNLRRLVEEELGGYARKLVCHPARDGAASATIGSALGGLDGQGRVLLAVGPEGGWEDYGARKLLPVYHPRGARACGRCHAKILSCGPALRPSPNVARVNAVRLRVYDHVLPRGQRPTAAHRQHWRHCPHDSHRGTGGCKER